MPGKKRGAHAASIDLRDFREFLQKLDGLLFDLMCEIKDKEGSALKALDMIKKK
jgi:UV DNA damage endonuclease